MKTGKCPKCDAVIQKYRVEAVPAEDPSGTKWQVFSIVANCGHVISAQANPMPIAADVIRTLEEKVSFSEKKLSSEIASLAQTLMGSHRERT